MASHIRFYNLKTMKYFEAREGKFHCTELICMVSIMRRTNSMQSFEFACGASGVSHKNSACASDM